jgi:predicted lipid-binding transport protein (Tim44 family)
MGNDLQLLDILIFAMVAGFLFLRLHRVLGKRTGHEQPPGRVAEDETRNTDVVPLHPKDSAPDEPPNTNSESELVPGIDDLKKADPGFQPEEFLTGVETAFEMIVEAFSRGDMQILQSLLDDPTLQGFKAEIKRRGEAHEEVDSGLISIDTCQIVEAKIDGSSANVTVNIVSQQAHVVRDSDTGTAVEGGCIQRVYN